MSGARPQPWIAGPATDGALILLPPLAATAAAWIWAQRADGAAALPPLAWLVLVVLIDVAHVYATLYRTYLDPGERRRRRLLYVVTPLAAWVVGIGLYAAGAMTFWRVLAYAAAFHFVRQQYGFVRLYARRDHDLPPVFRRLDALAIYAATLYPLIHWHAHAPRAFSWFVEGDLVAGLPVAVERVAFVVYLGVLACWGAAQLHLAAVRRRVNLPKLLVTSGTVVSWYVGIVHFDGDVAFTLTNVVAHGVPYMALVWAVGRRRDGRPPLPAAGLAPAVAGFLALLFALAYLEEGLWDGLVWREHLSLFPGFAALPALDGQAALTWLVPLLAVPQVTHYVVDGFIWKVRAQTALP